MLRHRLFSGTLMTLLFSGLALVDGWLDGTITASPADDWRVRGSITAALMAAVILLGLRELGRLAAASGVRVFGAFCAVGAVAWATTWYWSQLAGVQPWCCAVLVAVMLVPALFLFQYARCGTTSVLANCGASYFCIAYLGALGSFVLGIRIDFGLWALLMFIFVIKSADIGAYIGGSAFGRHKFSPRVSPGKTWEGMAAAVIAAVIVAVAFAGVFAIMSLWSAAAFGVCFAFAGQMGDLAESMIKRDARQKDSGNDVPGFGGILDVIDSPLLAGPFAYLFFQVAGRQVQ